MKTEITRPAVQCDGCGYLIGSNVGVVTVSARGHVFDFHDGGEGAAERHDCFRYWAHGPRIMENSLKDRGLDEQEIDDFLAVMLYRTEGAMSSPGIPRQVTA